MSIFGKPRQPNSTLHNARGPLADMIEGLKDLPPSRPPVAQIDSLTELSKAAGLPRPPTFHADLADALAEKPPARDFSPPPTLSPEAQAIRNQKMIDEITNFRETVLAEYQRRIDAAQRAYTLADETTRKMIGRVSHMADENAREISALDSQVSALATLSSTYDQVPHEKENSECPTNQSNSYVTAPPPSTLRVEEAPIEFAPGKTFP